MTVDFRPWIHALTLGPASQICLCLELYHPDTRWWTLVFVPCLASLLSCLVDCSSFVDPELSWEFVGWGVALMLDWGFSGKDSWKGLETFNKTLEVSEQERVGLNTLICGYIEILG